jgi:uncharacterized protein YbjT (DUF2867 family)
MIESKVAIVIGATGLVGTALINELCKHPEFSTIKVFHRRKIGAFHSKVEEHVVNFNEIESWKHKIQGDVLFSALGTTLKVAGSKEKQYLVDYTFQYNVAKHAAEQGVKQYILVSSGGANPNSSMFYLRMKGELEKDINELSFQSTYFIRPNLLKGDRIEKRIGEQVGEFILTALNKFGILLAQKPIHVSQVAREMINAYHEAQFGTWTWEGKDLKTRNMYFH